MKQIIVNSPKYGQQVAQIDDNDFDMVSKHNWHLVKRKHTMYVASHIGTDKNKNRTTLLLHRLILKPLQTDQIDHSDGNGLNNQRSNIRVCTGMQNAKNIKKPITNTTGYKGVFFVDNNYLAQITSNRKIIYLGKYKTAIQAAVIYNEAAKKYHGEFARLNVIDEKLLCGVTFERSNCNKQILQIDKNGNIVKKWDSVSQASRALKINHGNMSLMARGINRRHYCGGFKWQYV